MQYNRNFSSLDCFLGRMFLGGAWKDEMFSVLRVDEVSINLMLLRMSTSATVLGAL